MGQDDRAVALARGWTCELLRLIGVHIQLIVFVGVVASATPRVASAILVVGGTQVTARDVNYMAIVAIDGDYGPILDAMLSSQAETFSFPNGINQAAKHCAVRKAIWSAMGQTNPNSATTGAIDFWYADGGSLQYAMNGSAEIFNSAYGNVPNNIALDTIAFQVAPGVAASLAISTIEGGRTRTECETSATSMVLIGHRRVMGNAWLDGQVAAGQLKIPNTAYSVLAQRAVDPSVFVPGDHAYMLNEPRYLLFMSAYARFKKAQDRAWKPTGDFGLATGEYVIVNGDGTYSGLGWLGKTDDGLRGALADQYISDTGMSDATYPLALQAVGTNGQVDPAKLASFKVEIKRACT